MKPLPKSEFEVIVTLGPGILSTEKLPAIHALGKCIYRINGAHVQPGQIAGVVKQVRSALPDARLMIDLPGNKIRTANFSEPLRLVKGEKFELAPSQVNYGELYKLLKPGMIVLANDSIYRLEVMKIAGDRIHFLSHSDGLLQNNKGLHVPGINSDLPFLFQRDLDLIRAGAEGGVDYVSLSFVRNAKDVREAQRALDATGKRGLTLIAKIETKAALENLNEILDLVEIANIDRGDLSSDIGLLPLGRAQERVIQTAIERGKRIFLATQFLKNMETLPVPLIAEVADLYKTVCQGISGIQLSEETAVGRYPTECVKMVFDMVALANEA